MDVNNSNGMLGSSSISSNKRCEPPSPAYVAGGVVESASDSGTKKLNQNPSPASMHGNILPSSSIPSAAYVVTVGPSTSATSAGFVSGVMAPPPPPPPVAVKAAVPASDFISKIANLPDANEPSASTIARPQVMMSGGKSKAKKNDKDQSGGRWSPEEDDRLRKIVVELGAKNWKKISAVAFDGKRTDVQCLHRWQKVLKPGLVKGSWTKREDMIVMEMVKKHGVGNIKWSVIAAELPGRLGKQCRERWFNHLDPALKKEPWSVEEDKILMEAQATMGNRWCQIAQLLPGRSENAVKNRWNSAMRRRVQNSKEGQEEKKKAKKAKEEKKKLAKEKKAAAKEKKSEAKKAAAAASKEEGEIMKQVQDADAIFFKQQPILNETPIVIGPKTSQTLANTMAGFNKTLVDGTTTKTKRKTTKKNAGQNAKGGNKLKLKLPNHHHSHYINNNNNQEIDDPFLSESKSLAGPLDTFWPEIGGANGHSGGLGGIGSHHNMFDPFQLTRPSTGNIDHQHLSTGERRPATAPEQSHDLFSSYNGNMFNGGGDHHLLEDLSFLNMSMDYSESNVRGGLDFENDLVQVDQFDDLFPADMLSQ